MPNAMIFDVDGVLIDSYDAHFKSWRQLGRERDIEISEQMFAAEFGRRSAEIIRAWWGEDMTDEQVREMDERKEAHFRDIIREEFPAMPGARELITALHDAGFALAVGSSGPPPNVDLVLEMLDRDGRIAAKVTGADVTRGKPDPQVFLIAAERLDVSPQQCAVLEDAVAGVKAAKAAGMVAIALTGTTGRDELREAGADHVVDSLRELSAKGIGQLIKQNVP